MINESVFPERLLMRTYDEAGNLLTECDEDKGWFENGTEQTEYGEWRMTRIYHPYTESELIAIKREKDKAKLIESRRELTLEEVTSLILKAQINSVDIPDQTSLRMVKYYPTFSEIVGQTVKQGFKFVHADKLYKTVQPELLIQAHYAPGIGTESLYTRIDLEHTGEIYDPIPYEGNMELFEGKYYIQDEQIYLCTRSTGVAVYHALADLIGHYVTIT